jgi:hypothetical protein
MSGDAVRTTAALPDSNRRGSGLPLQAGRPTPATIGTGVRRDAVNFNLSIWINRPPGEVFALLRDKDEYLQKPGSPVLALDRLTPGPVRVGTRYREVVRMLPGVRGEIRSVVTRFEPPARLEESFAGAGMAGNLAYEFVPDDGGTRLVQRERLVARGWLAPLSPFIPSSRPAGP